MQSETEATLGVVIVAYASEDVICECLETLIASVGVKLKIVVVDNASTDGTCAAVIDWASGETPFVQPENSPLERRDAVAKPVQLRQLSMGEDSGPLGQITLIRSDLNRGFAGGVNVGLKALAGQADLIWVLNPDCAVPPTAARSFVEAASANPRFALMTCRTIYYDQPDRIQTDGGQVNRFTGACRQLGYGQQVSEAPRPNAADIDWVTGANMVVSSSFIAKAGLMTETYFLYYEEVDWAFRRGDMALAIAPDAFIYHRGGTSIGTGSIARRPSPFANYFNHRNRVWFARRFLSRFPVGAYMYGLFKAGQLVAKGAFDEAHGVLSGTFDLPPPRSVANRFSEPAVVALAFGRQSK